MPIHTLNADAYVGDHVDRADVDATTTVVGLSASKDENDLNVTLDCVLPIGKNVVATCEATIETAKHIKEVTTTSTINLPDMAIHTVVSEPDHLEGWTPGIGMTSDLVCSCKATL